MTGHEEKADLRLLSAARERTRAAGTARLRLSMQREPGPVVADEVTGEGFADLTQHLVWLRRALAPEWFREGNADRGRLFDAVAEAFTEKSSEVYVGRSRFIRADGRWTRGPGPADGGIPFGEPLWGLQALLEGMPAQLAEAEDHRTDGAVAVNVDPVGDADTWLSGPPPVRRRDSWFGRPAHHFARSVPVLVWTDRDGRMDRVSYLIAPVTRSAQVPMWVTTELANFGEPVPAHLAEALEAIGDIARDVRRPQPT